MFGKILFSITLLLHTYYLFSQPISSLKSKIKLDTSYNINSNIFSILPIDDKLFIGDGDGNIHMVKPNGEINKLNFKQQGWVNTIEYNKSNNLLLSGGFDGLVYLYDLTNDVLQKKIECSSDNINYLKYLNDTLIIISADSLYLVNINSEKKIKKFYFRSKISSLLYEKEKQLILLGLENGNIVFFDSNKFIIIREIKSLKSKVTSLAYSRDKKDIAVGYDNGSISLISSKNYKIYKTIKPHIDLVSGIVFSIDNKYIISSSWDKNIFVWNRNNYQLELNINAHKNIVTSISLWNNKLITAGFDNIVNIWKNF